MPRVDVTGDLTVHWSEFDPEVGWSNSGTKWDKGHVLEVIDWSIARVEERLELLRSARAAVAREPLTGEVKP